jgi:hypothetical protein
MIKSRRPSRARPPRTRARPPAPTRAREHLRRRLARAGGARPRACHPRRAQNPVSFCAGRAASEAQAHRRKNALGNARAPEAAFSHAARRARSRAAWRRACGRGRAHERRK